MSETRWLDEQEQRAWRSYIQASAMLQERLGRDLDGAHGLSSSEYEILVRLSESPDRRLRMAQVAEQVVSSRSRLTHTVSRLEASGYVERQPCESDRRGVQCVLTDRGFAALESAAHTHVRGVRSYLLDALTREEFLALGAAMQTVQDHLAQVPDVERHASAPSRDSSRSRAGGTKR